MRHSHTEIQYSSGMPSPRWGVMLEHPQFARFLERLGEALRSNYPEELDATAFGFGEPEKYCSAIFKMLGTPDGQDFLEYAFHAYSNGPLLVRELLVEERYADESNDRLRDREYGPWTLARRGRDGELVLVELEAHGADDSAVPVLVRPGLDRKFEVVDPDDEDYYEVTSRFALSSRAARPPLDQVRATVAALKYFGCTTGALDGASGLKYAVKFKKFRDLYAPAAQEEAR